MGRKSAKIANKKGAADRQRSLLFTKALHDVAVAVKSGGPDVESNFLLKIALERCKKFNVPKDNIERAIKRGSGGEGADYQDVTYEGYGPGGVAIFVETSTNNVTRTVANVRSYFKKNNGSLGTNGSLEFIFDRKSVFSVSKELISEDDLTMAVIDVGAEDIQAEGELFEIYGPMESFGTIQTKLQEINIVPEEASLKRIPTTYKEDVDDETAEQVDKIIELLESDEDVTCVYHNMKE